MSLGRRIADLRQQRGLTLQDVAAGAGLTPSFLSRLERDHANISVANLRKLAGFFGVPMTYFFADEAAAPIATVVRAAVRTRLSQPADAAQIFALTPPGSPVEARLIEAPPGATGASDGAQLFFVIGGELRCRVGTESYTLDGGDTLLMRRGAAVAWECVSAERSVTLVVWTARDLT
jgi:transcriptional regulator with XRE-family HTH domain